jgi:hypothetical protein
MNDVRVHGVGMTTVLIEDIAMDVPSGSTVVIPAVKAAKSKDLWRLLSQRQLFRLNAGPFQDFPSPTPPPPPNGEAEMLREQVRLLSERNHVLENALGSQGGKLDAILGLLGNVSFGAVASQPQGRAATSEVVDTAVPTFIPSQIKPDNVESHVEIQSETSEGSSIAGAGEALRRLRKGSR